MTSAAEPGAPVPVAVVMRTSTLALQDPLSSLRRQMRSCDEWLPEGWYVAGYYWDVESGGIDLEDRSQGEDHAPFVAAGIPRDGGMADLLHQASAPDPPFAAVVCEDIERSGRDTYNALKLERQLSDKGVPLFAADEPADVQGIGPTTVLVRRIKQGVAEYFRLQLRKKTWDGLREHAIAGWNIGVAPYGYTADRTPHPVAYKAQQGKTKTRLILDPLRGPVVAAIFLWRTEQRLGIPAITARLNASHGQYPPPAGGRWLESTVGAILANPKYTGHMVYGRRRKTGRTHIPVPPRQVDLVPRARPPRHHQPRAVGRGAGHRPGAPQRQRRPRLRPAPGAA